MVGVLKPKKSIEIKNIVKYVLKRRLKMKGEFKVKDWVLVETENGWEDAVIVYNIQHLGYYQVEILSSGKICSRKEEDIKPIISMLASYCADFWSEKLKDNANKCTCGASHTSNPKSHSSWCDVK